MACYGDSFTLLFYFYLPISGEQHKSPQELRPLLGPLYATVRARNILTEALLMSMGSNKGQPKTTILRLVNTGNDKIQ
jgi:hypothetical protein